MMSLLLVYSPVAGEVIGLPKASFSVMYTVTKEPTLRLEEASMVTVLWLMDAAPALTSTCSGVPSILMSGRFEGGVTAKL
jgi:hypothetical protein